MRNKHRHGRPSPRLRGGMATVAGPRTKAPLTSPPGYGRGKEARCSNHSLMQLRDTPSVYCPRFCTMMVLRVAFSVPPSRSRAMRETPSRLPAASDLTMKLLLIDDDPEAVNEQFLCSLNTAVVCHNGRF